MSRRSEEQWQALVQEHAASKESQTKFCKARGLSTKHFSQKRRELLDKGSARFVELSPVLFTEPGPSTVSLDYQGVQLKIQGGDARFIAELIRQLA